MEFEDWHFIQKKLIEFLPHGKHQQLKQKQKTNKKKKQAGTCSQEAYLPLQEQFVVYIKNKKRKIE